MVADVQLSVNPVVRIPVEIRLSDRVAPGTLTLPDRPQGLIALTRGEALYRPRPSDTRVAQVFAKYQLATLDADIALFPHAVAPDLAMLATGLAELMRWARSIPALAGLPMGCCAIGAGAAVALKAAAAGASPFQALVLRNGRPDLEEEVIAGVKAPVLFIVGGDPEGMVVNRNVLEKLGAPSAINVIPYASPGFEELGAVEDAAQLAALWFSQHLKQEKPPA
jgi:putative phosphoribosyl transferase